MNFTFVPWGNAYYNTTKCGGDYFDKQNGMYCWIKECGGDSPASDCFTGKKWCQHGNDECDADTLEGCAVKHYPDVNTYWPFINCFEGKQKARMTSAKACATKASMDYSILETCLKGSDGEAIDAMNAQMTAKFGSSRLGTPWVVVNGKALEDPSTLLQTVCAAYSG
jgi:hypothetical protein